MEDHSGLYFRRRRHSLGIALMEFAAMLGMGAAHLQDIEAGKERATDAELEKLENVVSLLSKTPRALVDAVERAR